MIVALLAALLGAPAPQRLVDQGLAIEFTTSAPARAGEPVAFAFDLTDTATAAPIRGVRPAAWLARRGAPDGRPPNDCARQVATYLGGDLFGRPEVDLNSYFVLALNDDASIHVVDPLFGFGGSKLLAMLPLASAGEDWVLSADQRRLFVSMPAAGKVAVADTWKWQLEHQVETGPHPRRLVLGERLWVAHDDGLTAIDPHTLAATHLRFGAVRDVVLDSDGALVFAAIERAVVIVDARQQRVLARVAIDADAAILGYSAAGATLYALDPDSGRIVAIDPRARQVVAAIDAQPGAVQLRFAPNGRHALIPNPQRNLVQVLDAAVNRIVQTAEIGDGPDQVTFTPLLAYVRRRASETVLMVPLDQLGVAGQPLGVADFPGGQHAYGERTRSLADSIVETPESPGVLVANPADRMIYLYREGMAAPAGGFSNYGRQPRAVLVVDRGLRESLPGRYQSTLPVEAPGTYDVAFFLDSPRVIACFALTVGPGTAARAAAAPPPPPTLVTAIAPPAHLVAGETARLRFALVDPEQGARRRASDVRALAFAAPGIWQRRGAATPLADGTYAFEFVPPDRGMYYVWLESVSLGLAPNNPQFLVYEAR